MIERFQVQFQSTSRGEQLRHLKATLMRMSLKRRKGALWMEVLIYVIHKDCPCLAPFLYFESVNFNCSFFILPQRISRLIITTFWAHIADCPFTNVMHWHVFVQRWHDLLIYVGKFHNVLFSLFVFGLTKTKTGAFLVV